MKPYKHIKLNYYKKIVESNMNISDWIRYEDENIVVHMIINLLANSKDFYNDMMLHVFNNRFIGQDVRNIIESYISLAKHRRFIVCKCIRGWRYQRNGLMYKNDCDLMLETFDDNKVYPQILEKNCIYRFSKSDVNNMITSKVLYSEYQESRILPIKNPWTNEKLSKTQLYNLFVSAYDSRNMPWILVEYAKLDFDNALMMTCHRSYLTKEAIRSDVKQYSENEFRRECETIFVHNIANLFTKYNEFRYNGLKSVALPVLKKFFTQLIVYSHLNYRNVTVSVEQKRQLFKLWELNPSIMTMNDYTNKNSITKKNKKHKKNGTTNYRMSISRARIIYTCQTEFNFSLPYDLFESRLQNNVDIDMYNDFD